MTPILFKEDVSPASRSVLLTVKALGLKVDFKDVPGGEGPKPGFIKVNIVFIFVKITVNSNWF